jgi:lysophospholipase L1-like esterase
MTPPARPPVALMVLGAALLCLLFAAPRGACAAETSFWPGVHRVVFLGDSITYDGRYVEEIEACLILRFPARRFEIINLGLPSETVSGLTEPGHANGQFPRPDLHERLERVLEKTKPGLVVACYGMNDGIYLPFAENRFQKFQDGIRRLHDRVTKAGAKILHVTPPTFDEVKGGSPGYANTLDRYSDWLLAQRAEGWDVADVHGPMGRYLAERRAKEPSFFLARDGVHAGAEGQWIIARELLRRLGVKDLDQTENAATTLAAYPNGAQVLNLVEQRQRMMKDAWLTETRHLRPGMKKGLPLLEAQRRAAEIEWQIRGLANP